MIIITSEKCSQFGMTNNLFTSFCVYYVHALIGVRTGGKGSQGPPNISIGACLATPPKYSYIVYYSFKETLSRAGDATHLVTDKQDGLYVCLK